MTTPTIHIDRRHPIAPGDMFVWGFIAGAITTLAMAWFKVILTTR